MLRIGLVASLALLLGACGATIGSTLLLPPGSTSEYFVGCLKKNGFIPSQEELSLSAIQKRLTSGLLYPRDGSKSPQQRFLEKGYVNLYLDCYLAEVDTRDVEGRLLRGHIVLTLLAQYGSASLVAKERVSKPDDAIAMQGHIRRAQFHLLSASPSGLRATYGLDKTDADGKPLLAPGDARTATKATAELSAGDLPNFHSARRVAAVFDVGLDLARVDGRYIASLAGSVFDIVSGAISSGGLSLASVSKLQDLMAGVAQGMQLAALNQWYGPAFLLDAELAIPSGSSSTPIATVGEFYYREVGRTWLYWQRRLTVACDGLSVLAGEKKTTCLPTAGEMADFLEEEYGDHPFVSPLRNKAKDDAIRKAKAGK
jgi:hypothetical protein